MKSKFDIEESICSIWSNKLQIEEIGLEDDFFKIGGNVIKATGVLKAINNEFNIKLVLSDFIKNPSINSLAQKVWNERILSKYLINEGPSDDNEFGSVSYLNSGDSVGVVKGSDDSKTRHANGSNNIKKKNNVKPLEKRERYNLSNQQKAAFMYHLMNKKSTAYSPGYVWRAKGNLDLNKFKDTINKLIQRHELLRTTYHFDSNGFTQKVHDEINFKVEHIKETDKNKISEIIKNYNKIFDLTAAPPYTICLITESSDKHYLIFCAHSVICDWIGAYIFINDLLKLYDGFNLEPLKIQYKDYIEWQNKNKLPGSANSMEQYWIKKLSGKLHRLDLPYDFPRNEKHRSSGKTIGFKFDSNLTESLNDLAAKKYSTLFMLLVTTYNILLSKITNQDDIIMAFVGSQREDEKLKNVIGSFVNMITLRNKVEPGSSFTELLYLIKKDVLASIENQDYPLELILEKINYPRELNRNPVFDTSFNFLSLNRVIDKAHDLKSGVTFERIGSSGSIDNKYDLTVAAGFDNKEINFTVTYDSVLFKEDTVKDMFMLYVAINKQVVSNPEILIKDIRFD